MGELNNPLDEAFSGEIELETSATQLPSVPAGLVYFSAPAANAGNIYIGGAAVSIPEGTADAVAGIQLAPGITLPAIPISNLDKLYLIADNETDLLSYLVLR